MTILNLGGLSHPPGYPIYTLIGRLFCLVIPFGPPAFKASLLSAVFASCTIAVLFIIVNKITQSIQAALLSSGLYAVSRIFWTYATVAEVFSLAAFTTVIIIFVFLKLLHEPHTQRNYFYFGLSFALGIAHHHSVIFLFPLLVFLSINLMKQNISARNTVFFAFFFLLGLIPGILIYGTLPLLEGPWKFDEVNSLSDIYNFFIRKHYGVFTEPNIKWWDNPLTFFINLLHEFCWIGSIFGFIGMVIGLKMPRYKYLSMAILTCFILSGPIFLSLFDQPSEGRSLIMLERFYIISHLLFALFIGIGYSYIKSKLTNKMSENTGMVVTISLLALGLFYSFPKSNHAQWTVLEDYCNNSLSVIEKNALVILHGDLEFSGFLYMQKTLNQRPDILFLSPDLLRSKWYRGNIKKNYADFRIPIRIGSQKPGKDFLLKLINLNLPSRPIYLSQDYWDDGQNLIDNIPPTYPYKGILLKVCKDTLGIPKLDLLKKELEQSMATYTFNSIPHSPYDYNQRWEGLSYYQYAKAYNILGDLYLKAGEHENGKRMKIISAYIAQPWIKEKLPPSFHHNSEQRIEKRYK